jgi:hypothetical protein
MLINLSRCDLDRAVESLAVAADNIFFYSATPTGSRTGQNQALCMNV